jgi:hypothetical protein
MSKENIEQTPAEGTPTETPSVPNTEKQEGGEQTPPTTPENPETPATPPATPEEPEAPETPETPEPETPEVPSEPEVPTEPTEPTPPVEVDWKDKFSNSARESQILSGNLKELQKTIGELTKEDIPTDEEMLKQDPDWNVRSDYEKNMAVKLEATQRMQRRIALNLNNAITKTEKASALSQLVHSDARLQGKEDKFLEFVEKPKHANIPLDVLVNAFLFETPVETPAPETPPAEDVPPALGRSTPSGGTPTVQKKEGEYSDEELKHLRTTNPKKYNKMIQSGQIK